MYLNIPFFSVCISVTNRESTIFAALSSVAHQICRDFELIIVDCGSTDKSRQEIERFFSSEEYRQHSFPYIYECRDYIPQTVEDWNEPIRLAKGRYIAMLEGDDQFLPQNLQAAYAKLSDNLNIGLYATGNQQRTRGVQGYLSTERVASFIYSHQEVPPPSETIFIRTDYTEKPFLYNEKEYEYAPEVDLYIRIALAGYAAFFANTQYTLRDISHKDRTSWHYFHDRFVIAQKYAIDFGIQRYRTLLNESVSLAISASLSSRDMSNIWDIAHKLIRIVGLKYYLRAFASVSMRVVGKRIKRISYHK